MSHSHSTLSLSLVLVVMIKPKELKTKISLTHSLIHSHSTSPFPLVCLASVYWITSNVLGLRTTSSKYISLSLSLVLVVMMRPKELKTKIYSHSLILSLAMHSLAMHQTDLALLCVQEQDSSAEYQTRSNGSSGCGRGTHTSNDPRCRHCQCCQIPGRVEGVQGPERKREKGWAGSEEQGCGSTVLFCFLGFPDSSLKFAQRDP